MMEGDFPIRLTCCIYPRTGPVFESHWHEHIEFLYFLKGRAVVQCNSVPIDAEAGDLIVINSNELHSGESKSEDLVYYAIIIDVAVLHSAFVDSCETKYIKPIEKNLILFENKVKADKNMTNCINSIMDENRLKETGYELAVKSHIYMLVVMLLRNHVKRILSKTEYNVRLKNLERFKVIFRHIHDDFAEDLSINAFSRLVNISSFHFCRLFKELTGKTFSEYVNEVRISKAEEMLAESDLSISEIAINSGFNDINYFSRVFKQYRKIPPKEYRKIFRH